MKYVVFLLVLQGCYGEDAPVSYLDTLSTPAVSPFKMEYEIVNRDPNIVRYENKEAVCYKSSIGFSCWKK